MAPAPGPLVRRWRRFLALSRSDRRLLLGVWVLLCAISLSIALSGCRRTRRLLEYLLPRTAGKVVSTEALDYAEHVGALARMAGRHLPLNASCLRQSLLLWWLLRRKGLAAVLRIGVNREQGFRAHAWVELDGRPVNDAPDVAVRFRALEGPCR